MGSQKTVSFLEKFIDSRYRERLNNEKVLFIGIDSGTYRCRAVGSNGKMAEILSFVGTLKRNFGTKILLGEEALRYRTELDSLIRPLQFGYLYSPDMVDGEREEAYGILMKHLKECIVPPDYQGPVIAVVSIPIIDETEAGIKNRALIVELLEKKKKLFDYVELVPQPFAGTVGAATEIPEISNYTIAIDQGAGTCAVAAVRNINIPTSPKYQGKSIFAGDRKDEMFVAKANKKISEKGILDIENKFPLLDIDTARILKERYDYVSDTDTKVPYSFVSRKGSVELSLSQELRDISEQQLNEVVSLMIRVRSRLPFEEQDRYENCVLLGEGSRIKNIEIYLQKKIKEYLPSNSPFAEKIFIRAKENHIFDQAKGALIYALNTDEALYRDSNIQTI